MEGSKGKLPVLMESRLVGRATLWFIWALAWFSIELLSLSSKTATVLAAAA